MAGEAPICDAKKNAVKYTDHLSTAFHVSHRFAV
jgi:hypothetical protein